MVGLEQEGCHELGKPVSHKGRAMKLATLAFGVVLALGLLSACGDKLKDAKVTAAENAGVSEDSTDPTKVS